MEPTKEPSRTERIRRWLAFPFDDAPSISSDARWVLFLSNRDGIPRAYGVRPGSPRVIPLVGTLQRTGAVQAAPEGTRALLALDRGGDENWTFHLVDLAREGSPGDGDPPPLPGVPRTKNLPGRWRDGTRYAFSSTMRDPRYFDVVELDVDRRDPPRTLFANDGWNQVVDADADSVLVLASRSNLDQDLYLIQGERILHLNPHDEEEGVNDAALRRGEVYAAANPHREFQALVRYRPGRAGPEILRAYPGDVEMVRADPKEGRLAVVVNRDGWSETHLVDPDTGEDRTFTSGPRGVVTELQWFPDGSSFAFAISSATDGHEIYLRSVESGKERRLMGTSREPPSRILPPKRGEMKASDGTTIPWWEYRPVGRPMRGTLVELHGGPESQARPAFDRLRSILLEEGFRIIEPNVRGSRGYGKTYLHLDDGALRPGAARDVREVVEAIRRRDKGTGGPWGVYGASYGGYLTLASITRDPELFQAAVDVVGIADLVTFLENTSPWRRHIREVEYGSLATDREMLREISPLTHARRIRSPLLVLHGRNDPRVPVSEAEALARVLQEQGIPVELVIYEDEGHGIVRRKNQEDAFQRLVEFFDRHLPSA